MNRNQPGTDCSARFCFCPPATARKAPHLLLALTIILILTTALPIHAQGCAQCLDTTRSTPPSVQAAYRHAILLLGGFAATLFVTGGILLTRRQR